MLAWFFRASGPVLRRNPTFCDFSGAGGPDPLCPLLDRSGLGCYVEGHLVFLQNISETQTIGFSEDSKCFSNMHTHREIFTSSIASSL